MTDEQLVAWLDNQVSPAARFGDTRLSKERTLLSQYYEGQLPAPLHAGNSKFVSLDVFDTVEGTKAILLEAFTGNRKPIRFTAVGAEDVKSAEVASTYCDNIVFSKNPGYFIVQDVVHSGLMNRAVVAEVYWETKHEWVEETQGPTSMDNMGAIAQAISAKGTTIREPSLEHHPDGTVTVHYERLNDLSGTRIEVVPPEEFGITPRAVNLHTAPVCFRRKRHSRADLLQMGIEKAVLDDLASDDGAWLDTDPELSQRHSPTDDTAALGIASTDINDHQTFLVYKVYAEMDLEGTDESALWEIIYAGSTILRKQRVQRRPFVVACLLPVPHRFWGNSFAANVVPIQNARTLLTRAIIDHAMVTTNPRYTVTRGGLTNPKELLENRLGGIINQTRDGAVQPLLQPPLNPFIFQTLQLLDAEKEEATGLSRLSQGLNKDVVSKQNSAEMVGQMMSVSQQRLKVLARNLAHGFLTDLFLAVYQLAIENETQERIVEIAGDFIPVDPQAWAERRDVTVEFAIGYGEDEKEAKKFLSIDQYLSMQPGLAPQYGAQQRFNVLRKTMEAMGIRDVGNYLLPPEQAQPAQPDPMQVQLAQVPLREIAVKEMLAKLAAGKAQAEAERKDHETDLKAGREGAKVEQARVASDLKERIFEHGMTVDAADIALQKMAIDKKPAPAASA